MIGSTFTPYGLAHWIMLAVMVVGAALLIALGRHHRNTPSARIFSRALGGTLVVITIGFMIIWLLPAFFDLQQSIPLHASDLLRLITAYALWSHRPWVLAITYYWGLTFNPQAIFTPDLHLGTLPVVEFASYWSQHLLVMWGVIYLTWGLGLHPSWRSYRRALVFTFGWAGLAFTINMLLGTNYGYLNGKPPGPSLLDVIGPWPWYLLAIAAAVVGVWALITWPWTRLNRADIDPSNMI